MLVHVLCLCVKCRGVLLKGSSYKDKEGYNSLWIITQTQGSIKLQQKKSTIKEKYNWSKSIATSKLNVALRQQHLGRSGE